MGGNNEKKKKKKMKKNNQDEQTRNRRRCRRRRRHNDASASASSSSAATAASASASWSRLPPEISHRILLFLPLHQALKASSVCKQWRSSLLPRLPLLSSSHLLPPSSSSSSTPLHVLSDHLLPILRPSSRSRSWFCYHRLSQKWLWVPGLTFLPTSFLIRSVLASRRGLLLLESFQNDLLICNLSTQDFALLPPLLGTYYSYPHVRLYANCFHLHVDPDGSAYSIFFIPNLWSSIAHLNVHSDEPVGSSPIFARFHSRRGSWELLRPEYTDATQLRHASWPHSVSYSVIDKYVAVDDCIFMLVKCRYTSQTQVLRYNIPSSSWSFVCLIPLKAISVKMVAVLRAIFFVELDEASLEFQIYKLQMPDLLLEVPETRINSGFGTVTDAWYASASSSSWPLCIYLGLRERANGVLEYNVMTNSWTQLRLPHFVEDQGGDNSASCVCAEGYELGLNTSVFYEGMGSEESEDEYFD